MSAARRDVPDVPARGRLKGRPRLEEGAAIDAAIIAAAIDLLLDRGEATTINDVAVASGLSRKTIYARYSNLTELMLRATRDLLSRSRHVPVPTEGSAQERLYGYFRAALDIGATRQSRAIQRLLTFNPTFVGSLKEALRESSDRQFAAPLREFFIATTASGELSVSDPHATAAILTKLVLAESLIPDPAADGPSGEDWRDARAQFLAKLLIEGLSAAHRPSSFANS